nr:hypothetical protein [Lysinibacillus timonensis]
MRKVSLIIMCLFINIFSITITASANETENSPEQFAKNQFENIVLEHVQSEDAPNYNLTSSTNISFGKLYKVHRLSNDFVTSKKSITEDQGIVESGEYIAVVYQDDVPVNVIGTTKYENGKYGLSTFGYGEDLAIALDSKSTNGGKIFYEMPADAWYIFENGRVSGFTKTAQLLTEEKNLSLPEFRNYIYEKYASQKEIIEYGQNTAVGGNYSLTYGEVIQEGPIKSEFIIIGFLVVSLILIVSFFVIKNRRNQKIS